SFDEGSVVAVLVSDEHTFTLSEAEEAALLESIANRERAKICPDVEGRRSSMYKHLRIVTLTASLAIVSLTACLLGQAADPLVGTWQLNLAKSKFSPGPAPRSETRTYVAAGPEIKATSK